MAIGGYPPVSNKNEMVINEKRLYQAKDLFIMVIDGYCVIWYPIMIFFH
jgi:hypothetical protein